jgi:hypothetical protein
MRASMNAGRDVILPQRCLLDRPPARMMTAQKGYEG